MADWFIEVTFQSFEIDFHIVVGMQRIDSVSFIVGCWAVRRVLVLRQNFIEVMVTSSHHCHVEALCIAGEGFVGRMVDVVVSVVIIAPYDAHGA